jgi:excisionase family DNA binding protein
MFANCERDSTPPNGQGLRAGSPAAIAAGPEPGTPAAEMPARLQDPLIVDADGLAELLGISRRTLRRWLRDDRLPAGKTMGSRTAYWSVEEIRAWAAAGMPCESEWSRLWQLELTRRRTGRS